MAAPAKRESRSRSAWTPHDEKALTGQFPTLARLRKRLNDRGTTELGPQCLCGDLLVKEVGWVNWRDLSTLDIGLFTKIMDEIRVHNQRGAAAAAPAAQAEEEEEEEEEPEAKEPRETKRGPRLRARAAGAGAAEEENEETESETEELPAVAVAAPSPAEAKQTYRQLVTFIRQHPEIRISTLNTEVGRLQKRAKDAVQHLQAAVAALDPAQQDAARAAVQRIASKLADIQQHIAAMDEDVKEIIVGPLPGVRYEFLQQGLQPLLEEFRDLVVQRDAAKDTLQRIERDNLEEFGEQLRQKARDPKTTEYTETFDAMYNILNRTYGTEEEAEQAEEKRPGGAVLLGGPAEEEKGEEEEATGEETLAAASSEGEEENEEEEEEKENEEEEEEKENEEEEEEVEEEEPAGEAVGGRGSLFAGARQGGAPSLIRGGGGGGGGGALGLGLGLLPAAAAAPPPPPATPSLTEGIEESTYGPGHVIDLGILGMDESKDESKAGVAATAPAAGPGSMQARLQQQRRETGAAEAKQGPLEQLQDELAQTLDRLALRIQEYTPTNPYGRTMTEAQLNAIVQQWNSLCGQAAPAAGATAEAKARALTPFFNEDEMRSLIACGGLGARIAAAPEQAGDSWVCDTTSADWRPYTLYVATDAATSVPRGIIVVKPTTTGKTYRASGEVPNQAYDVNHALNLQFLCARQERGLVPKPVAEALFLWMLLQQLQNGQLQTGILLDVARDLQNNPAPLPYGFYRHLGFEPGFSVRGNAEGVRFRRVDASSAWDPKQYRLMWYPRPTTAQLQAHLDELQQYPGSRVRHDQEIKQYADLLQASLRQPAQAAGARGGGARRGRGRGARGRR